MADGQAPAFLSRKPGQAQKLLANGRALLVVIQKYSTFQYWQLVLPCHLACDTERSGTAVNEIKLLRQKLFHKPLHGFPLLGEQAAHVVVGAASLG